MSPAPSTSQTTDTANKVLSGQQKQERLALVAGLLLLGFLYFTTTPVWDDHFLFSYLEQTPFSQLMNSPVGLGDVGDGYYRPVSMILMKLGGGAGAVHLLILLFHMVTTWLVYQLTNQNWLMAMLFGLHPMCSEILGWSSALPDAAATFFSAIALFAIHKKQAGLAFLTASLALLSKENALVLIALLAVFYKPRLSSIGAIFLYFSIRFLLVGTTTVPFEMDRIFAGCKGILWLLGSSMFPFTVTAVRDIWHVTALEIGLGIAVVTFAGYLFTQGQRQQKLGAILWIMAPVIALPTIASSHLAAERYLYLGIFGMALALSAIRFPAKTTPFVGLLLAVVSIPIHYQQSRAWQSDIALFSQATKALPNSSYSHHLLGFAYLRENDFKQAASSFERGLQLEHSYPTERLLLIQSLTLSGNPEKALQFAEDGPKTDLTADYLVWWGRAAYETGQQSKAWQIWQPLLKINQDKTLTVLDGPPWFRAYLREAIRQRNAQKKPAPQE